MRKLLFAIILVLSSTAALAIGEGGITNPLGIVVESNGGLPVNIQDQTTPPFDLFFTQALAAPTTLAAHVAIDDRTLTVASSAGFAIGEYLGIFSGVSGERRFFFAEIINIVSTTITVDTPIDFAYMTGDIVIALDRDMDVDGSVTPVTFTVQAGGAGSTEFAVDITRLIIEITTSTAPPFDGFGDIAGGLTNGLVLRRVDGDTRNVWNVKTNSEFANLAYDYVPLSGFGPAVDGVLIRYTFAGQDKHGVAVRLEAGDSLQLIVQDDLTSLLSFRVIAAGHIVTD